MVDLYYFLESIINPPLVAHAHEYARDTSDPHTQIPKRIGRVSLRARTITHAIPLTHTRKDRRVLAGFAVHTHEYARDTLPLYVLPSQMCVHTFVDFIDSPPKTYKIMYGNPNFQLKKI